jgi:hypothetical protein
MYWACVLRFDSASSPPCRLASNSESHMLMEDPLRRIPAVANIKLSDVPARSMGGSDGKPKPNTAAAGGDIDEALPEPGFTTEPARRNPGHCSAGGLCFMPEAGEAATGPQPTAVAGGGVCIAGTNPTCSVEACAAVS